MLDFLTSSRDRSSLDIRLRRIERKLDLILQYMNVPADELDPLNQVSSAVRSLADQGRKIEAIKAYREQTGAGLRESKEMVESYMAGR